MLGWYISVYKQQNGGNSPASFDTSLGTRLIAWNTGIGGKKWLDDFVKEQKAIDLGGNGYPFKFTAMCRHLKEQIPAGQPESKDTRALFEACGAGEWLVVEVFDQS